MYNLYRWFVTVAFFIPAAATCQLSGNGKKIYADYHGVRYSREHDDAWGRWSYYRQMTKSGSPVKVLCYNADNILKNGRHDIAATAYPLTGPQSDLDPDYIEYQVLTAKAAGIDGFFIEWGFPEHESNRLLKAFQRIAAKYRFEIGVNWCDRWLYYDWITKIRPDIKTREDKTRHFQYSFQYLIDSVFTGPTAALVHGVPVFYLFGGGINNEEYGQYIVNGRLKLPEGTRFPVALKRFELWGQITNGVYQPPSTRQDFGQWICYGMSPTAWIPPRMHPAGKKYPLWNFYGTPEDMPNFMSSYKKVWSDTSGHVSLKAGFVAPGMDNRGCAGWGHDIFYLIPRANGRYYEDFWKYNMADKDKLDALFIASWSDFTEGHEIQPTIENGYRELQTTLRYAAEFKNEKLSGKGLELPLRLFQLRKKILFLQNTRQQTGGIFSVLDSVAQDISNAHYDAASGQLNRVSKQIAVLESRLHATEYILSKELRIEKQQQKELEVSKIAVPDGLKKQLKTYYYTGYIDLEYLDTGMLRTLNIAAGSGIRDQQQTTIGELKTAGSGIWKKAKVRIVKSRLNASDLIIKSEVPCRNIAIKVTLYK